MKTPLQRFTEKVAVAPDPHPDLGTPCWNWAGRCLPTGYPRFGSTGYAHRWSYEHHTGPIPENLTVDHRCHNRGCVNPGHLRLASKRQQQENISGANAKSKSGVRGVRFTKGKWEANVKVDGKFVYLGRFDTIEEAEAAAVRGRNERMTHNDIDRRRR